RTNGGQAGRLPYFDTICVNVGAKVPEILKLAEAQRINFRSIDEQTFGISLDETTAAKDVTDILSIFYGGRALDFSLEELAKQIPPNYAAPRARTTPYLTHPVFNRYHSVSEMMRYLKRLESCDLSLTTS